MVRKRNIRIQSQMQRILLVMAFLFVILCFLISHMITQIAIRNAKEYTKTSAQRLSNQLEFLYDKMDTFTLSIVNEAAVYNLMSSGLRESSHWIGEVEELFAYYKILDPNISDISLVNEEIHYTNMFRNEELDDLYEKATQGEFTWQGVFKCKFRASEEKSEMLTYGRKIIREGETIGLLLISLNKDYFQMLESLEEDAFFLLVDESRILYQFNGGVNSGEQIWNSWDKGKTEQTDQTYYIQSNYLENMNCYQLSAISLQRIKQSQSGINRMVWSCVILAVLFMVVLIVVVHIQVVEPLQKFSDTIRQIREQKKRNLDEELLLNGCSEINEIGHEFSGMLEDLSALNSKIFQTATDLYEMKLKKQQAELSYMRSQIDPHFLYNTLEVFRRKAMEKEAPELAMMAVDMGKIFRYSTKGDDFVPFEEELSIVKSYIRIQMTRFQDKLEVYYAVPEDILKVPVMKMMLQPLVENAIFHGIEPMENGGHVFIGARAEKGSMIVTIKDDGIGIEPDRLERIQKTLTEDYYDTKEHVGLLNTQARIKLNYGKDYGLTIESRIGDGTTVLLKLPMQQMEKNTLNDCDIVGETDVSDIDRR